MCLVLSIGVPVEVSLSLESLILTASQLGTDSILVNTIVGGIESISVVTVEPLILLSL